MKINCDNCGIEFNKRPSKLKKKNYCNKKCRHDHKYTDCTCSECGKIFERLNVIISKNNFCGLGCSRKYTSRRMSDMNIELNPNRMRIETRLKIRNTRIAKFSDTPKKATSYPKYLSRLEHRVIAEKMLGRPLKKGETVHHIDHNRKNNDPLNLMIFASQAEHTKWHANERTNPQANYE